MMSIIFLREKSDSFQKFKWYLARVEKEIGKNMKCSRSHRGRVFISNEFSEFYNERGIKRHVSTPRTPEHNGIVERRKKSIMECARTLLLETNVARQNWRELISTTLHTLN